MPAELTWLRLGKIFWSYSWRSILYLFVTMVLLFVSFVYLIGDPYEWFQDLFSPPLMLREAFHFLSSGIIGLGIQHLIGFFIAAPLFWLAFKRVVQIRYSDFKIHVLANNPQELTRKVKNFWWCWYWRTSILSIALEVFLFSLNIYLLKLSAGMFDILDGILSILIGVCINLIILKKLLRKDYGDFGVYLYGDFKL